VWKLGRKAPYFIRKRVMPAVACRMDKVHRRFHPMIGQALEHRHPRDTHNTAGDEHDGAAANLFKIEREFAAWRTNVQYVTFCDSAVEIIRYEASRDAACRAWFSLHADAEIFETRAIRQTVIAWRSR